MAKNDPLPEKYQKSIQLIAEGKLSYKDIAKVCHINESDFYDLVEGTANRNGSIQEKFTAALNEVNKQRDKEIRNLVKNCKKKTFYLIDDYLSKHPKVAKTDKSLVLTLTTIANALSKSTPNVEIGSFSYTKGLSPEDIYAEFTRLNGLASDRGSIQGSPKRGTGEVSVPFRSGSATSEESEDSILRTEPEA